MLLMNFNSQNKTENKNPHPASLLHADPKQQTLTRVRHYIKLYYTNKQTEPHQSVDSLCCFFLIIYIFQNVAWLTV